MSDIERKDRLEEVFDLVPAEVEENYPKQGDLVEEDEDIESDEDKSDKALIKRTYRDMIEKSSELLDTLTSIAEESEHPRAFEVASTLIRTIADVAGKLDDSIAKKEKRVGRGEEGTTVNKQVNNMYLTSSEDLMKLIRSNSAKDQ